MSHLSQHRHCLAPAVHDPDGLHRVRRVQPPGVPRSAPGCQAVRRDDQVQRAACDGVLQTPAGAGVVAAGSPDSDALTGPVTGGGKAAKGEG